MIPKTGQRYLRTEYSKSIIVEVVSDKLNSYGEYDCVVVQTINETRYSIGQHKSCALYGLMSITYVYLEGQDKP